MDDNLTQPLLNDVSGTPLHIADPHVEQLVSVIRENLDKVHWHNGRVRAHQQRLEQHMELVDASARNAEAALGSLLDYFSTQPGQLEARESDPDRRESYATALSRTSTPETTYTDVSYEQLVRDVNLTPNGGHTDMVLDNAETPAPGSCPCDKAIQTEERLGDTQAGGSSILFERSLFQTFSRTGPLHPFAYCDAPPASSISRASSSEPQPCLKTRNTKAANLPSTEPRKRQPTVASARPKEKGRALGAYLVLTSSGGTIYTDKSKANKAAKAKGSSSALPFLTEHDAQLALNGCVASNLTHYLVDANYQMAWFVVLKGSNPGFCDRSGLVQSIGTDYMKDLTSDDIIPTFTEKDAEDIYCDRKNMYVD
ncbi:hypothetical protein VNI00_018304 [Paramarasmius palmivorus]|uniref:Uncharacterized protein n=1 Tax=Paramarasmius palmivorus TaxID=297713 RepID=A0AAW0B0M5_9AGAR